MKSWSFWAFALVPWLLEILFGTHVFNTLLGSTLWTLILLLALIRHQVRDPRLRTGLMRGKWVVISAWLVIWFLSFLENPHPSLGATVPNLESKFWIQLHVALLTAGLAATFTLLVSSYLWFLQESRLRSESWERRGQGSRLPSLESLSRVSHLSARLALAFWTLGSFLAIATLLSSSKTREDSSLSAILMDDQIVGVVSFWILLFANWRVSKSRLGREKAFRGYLLFSAIFIVAFVIWTLFKDSRFHSPLRWLFP
jgi:hypothetical protein